MDSSFEFRHSLFAHLTSDLPIDSKGLCNGFSIYPLMSARESAERNKEIVDSLFSSKESGKEITLKTYMGGLTR